MKQFLATALVVLSLCACSDNTQQEKNLLNDILKVHDKVMGKDEILMKSKSHLDSLLKLKTKDTTGTAEIRAIDAKLVAAGDSMENWMNKFQPDMTGKSHDEVMQYYSGQKKQVIAVDSLVDAAIKESDTYISNHNKIK